MTLDQALRTRGATDWTAVDALTDADIDAAVAGDPDAAPLLTEEFWRNAELIVPGVDAEKMMISMRVDKDVVDVFKRLGPGYQARMNAVLRAWAYAHRS